MAGTDDHSHGTNAILAEILDVLRRMDGRLKGQEERIGMLENAMTLGKRDVAIRRRIETNGIRQMSVDAYSPTDSSTIRRPIPKPKGTARFSPHQSDEIQGRRSSAWNDHQYVLNQIRRDSIHNEEETSLLNRSQSLGRDIFKQKTWDTLSLPPLDADKVDTPIDAPADYSTLYSQFPPPESWISTKISARPLEIQYGLPGAEKLWNSYIGDSWTIPPDGRVELSFQKHLLERLDQNQADHLLRLLGDVTNKLEYQNPLDRAKRGSFRVFDFDIDPNFEESGMDYRAEFFTGMYKIRELKSPKRGPLPSSSTAFWKRIIEVRGLSRKLLDTEAVIASWRDPWVEAIPKLNSICPIFTERDESLHVGDLDVSQIIDRALEQHQKCIPSGQLKDDYLCFHIVFYELVSLRDDEEVGDEIWKYGKLHSDDVRERSRRLRESACTIIVIPDPSQQDYWTSLYLCPFNFDEYEKNPRIIGTQDAPSVAAHMVEFTIRVVIDRWLAITEYFAWLIGHRDALADPEIHDSLLFDDASFSRSRRYFWAINYLAELDESIAGNILQLETWIAKWPQHLNIQSKEMNDDVRSLAERLSQLVALQLRLRALRQEAIALRDGLFSASGVIESRAATRLGENVKLLTFVSIFFLPLSFCMSIWSISNAIFSLTSLAIVAVLIPCGTYFVVFNLNNLVRMTGTAYKKYKRKLVSQMKEDEDARWSEQGKRFETFRPRAERVEPSDWMIGFFILHKCLKATGVGNLFSRKKSRNKARRETISEEHELDFSILNGPRTAITGNPAGPMFPSSPENNIFLKGFSKLSFKFRRGAIVPGSVPGV